MTRAPYPHLRRFFEGYLHEDFVKEHGTPEAALRAFLSDASDAERARLAEDAKRMLAALESESVDEIHALLARLGARWTPRSRAAVTKLLEAAANDRRD